MKKIIALVVLVFAVAVFSGCQYPVEPFSWHAVVTQATGSWVHVNVYFTIHDPRIVSGTCIVMVTTGSYSWVYGHFTFRDIYIDQEYSSAFDFDVGGLPYSDYVVTWEISRR